MSKHNIQSVAEVVEILMINFQQEKKKKKQIEQEKWQKAFGLTSKDERLLNLWETDENIKGFYTFKQG